MKIRFLHILLVSAGCCIFVRQVPADQEGSTPHLVFKKSVVMKKYRDGQVYTDPHKIKKGEYLWKILRDHYKMSNNKIVNYSKIAGEINPQIKDINVIQPNQNIFIPYKYIKNAKSDNATASISHSYTEHTVKQGEHFAKILRDYYKLPDSIIFSRITRRMFKEANPGLEDYNKLNKGQKIVIPAEIFAMERAVNSGLITKETIEKTSSKTSKEPDAEQLKEETRIKDMLSLFVGSLQGSDNRTGQDSIVLKGKGAVSLDYNKFPLYKFPWGKKVFLDYGNKMSSEIRQAIGSEAVNVEVVSVREKQDMESILDKVLDACGAYRVEKAGEYMVNRDDVQLSVKGNWIVFKDNMMKNVFVVNLIDDSRAMSPQLQSYLSDIGLEFVDVETGITKKNNRQSSYSKNADFIEINSDPVVMTDTVLDILELTFSRSYSTNIFQNMYAGVSLEVVADRMFVKDGSTYLIDFSNLPERICSIIDDQGFNLLKIDPRADSPAAAVKKVLDFCAAAYQSPSAEIKYDRGKKSNIKLRIPGFLIETASGNVLLTGITLQEQIKKFLSETGVKIIKY